MILFDTFINYIKKYYNKDLFHTLPNNLNQNQNEIIRHRNNINKYKLPLFFYYYR